MSVPHRIISLSILAFATTVTPALAQQRPAPAASFKEEMGPYLEFIMAKCTAFGWGLIALSFLAALVIGFFAAWGISKLLTQKTGTLLNAVRYYGFGMLVSLLTFGIGGGLVWFAISSGNATLAIGAVGLCALTMLITSFAIPMKVYDIGFFKALFFNILVGIAAGAGQGVYSTIMPGPLDELKGKSPEEQRKIISQWRMQKREKELAAQFASAPALTPLQKVQQMHDLLQQERATLNVNDQAAVAAFNQRVAEYNAAKAQVQLTVAPPAAAPAPSTPAPAKRAK